MPQLPLDRRAGGMRGPALDDVATRLTEDQLIRQVLLGGGNMPAYGSALIPGGDDGAGTLSRNSAPQLSTCCQRCVAPGGGASGRAGQFNRAARRRPDCGPLKSAGTLRVCDFIRVGRMYKEFVILSEIDRAGAINAVEGSAVRDLSS